MLAEDGIGQPLLSPSGSVGGHDGGVSRRSIHRVQTFDEDGGDLDAYRRSIMPDSDEETGPDSLPGGEDYCTTSTFPSTTLSLTKVILGSGMLVIPKAFQLLGVPAGMLILSFVGLLTWYTIRGLVKAAGETGKTSYAAVVRTCCGHPAKWGILGAVFANCLGMCTVFLIIFSDILIGNVESPDGLIIQLVPGLDPSSQILNRKVVLAALMLVVLLPLGLRRSLASFGFLNIVGIGSVVAFAASTSFVACAAAYQGLSHPLPLLPDWALLGDTPLKVAASMLGIAPILLNSDICHQSVFPLMSVLKPYSQRSFGRMAALSLTICNLLYALIAITSIAAFGDGLQDDALSNLSPPVLQPIIGILGASVVSCTVRISYFVSLVGSFILMMHPLRHCVLEVLLGSNFEAQSKQEERLFVPVTLVLLTASYLLAVFIPSIWLVISLVGSAASTLQGFIFPGMVILMIENAAFGWEVLSHRIAASFIVLIGFVLFVNGFVSISL